MSTKSIAPGDIRVGATDTFLVLEVPEVAPRRRARALVKVLSRGGGNSRSLQLDAADDDSAGGHS